MIFNDEDLDLLAERTSYSLHASTDEKIEARKELKKINNLQVKVLNITEKELI